MLYLNTPFGAKQAMFEQAADMGASEIRLDLELSAVFPRPPQASKQGPSSPVSALPGPLSGGAGSSQQPSAAPDWSAVDQYMRLARRYHLRVLADLMSTPSYMASCPADTPRNQAYRCPPKDPTQWAQDAGKIAAHTRGVIDDFEIINEPDRAWAFLGTPQQYAAVLSAAYTAIHGQDPNARVVLGGIGDIGPSGQQWLSDVFATAGVDAAHSFDVANIHDRDPATQVGGDVCEWRSYFAGYGFTGPLWVTETGYPADRGEQTDSGYQDGPAAQARWLADVIPAMLAAGSARVFVTERDWGSGRYASEGVLETPDPLPPSPDTRRRPSFYAVQRLARGGWIAALRSDSQRHAGPAAATAPSCPAAR